MSQRLRRPAAPDLQDAVGTSARLAPPWAHAQANQRIVLAGVAVAYVLQHSRRQTIGFSVDVGGLAVRAPLRSTRDDVDAALRRKSAWILRKLAAADARRQALQASRTCWQQGSRVPYLGRELMLQVCATPQAARAQARRVEGSSGEPVLLLHVPPPASAQALANLTQRWMKAQARHVFAQRLQHFAPLLGVQWQRLRLSSARTRWGSASARGTISLHWRLVQLAPEIIDYVVVHELAHLLEMNHSPRFWAHVARVLPDYAERRAALRAIALPPW